MKKNVLPFEKPVVELREKIAELKKISGDSEVDLSAEIDRLEERLEHLEREVYENMAPWDRVQMARHAERPTTLDYIEQLFTDFLEMHVIAIIATMKQLSEGLPSLMVNQ